VPKKIPESKRASYTGRSSKRRFVGIPLEVADSEQFGRLSGNAIKFIVELGRFYNTHNNGTLFMPWSRAQGRWCSSGTLHKAKQEAIEKGFVICTRMGWKNRSSLFALTFWPINEADPKNPHDYAPTRAPSHDWKSISVVPIRTNVVPIRTNEHLEEAA
jgi:hypothetical protein